jgi:hypothetical protein
MYGSPMLNKNMNTDAESSDEDSDVQLDSTLQSKLYGMTGCFFGHSL